MSVERAIAPIAQPARQVRATAWPALGSDPVEGAALAEMPGALTERRDDGSIVKFNRPLGAGLNRTSRCIKSRCT
jgi:hypothetical protein